MGDRVLGAVYLLVGGLILSTVFLDFRFEEVVTVVCGTLGIGFGLRDLLRSTPAQHGANSQP